MRAGRQKRESPMLETSKRIISGIAATSIIISRVVNSASDSASKKARKGSGSEDSVSNETTMLAMPRTISATTKVRMKPFDGIVRLLFRLTPELSDHGQHQDGLAFRRNVHRCPWFAPVILLDHHRPPKTLVSPEFLYTKTLKCAG